MKVTFFFLVIILIISCQQKNEPIPVVKEKKTPTTPSPKKGKIKTPSIVILGTVQDGGSPHIGCKKDCCRELFEYPDQNRKVVSLGVFDPENNKKYIFEATPDFPEQMKDLKAFTSENSEETPDGIFLTHAHIGHYAGLMFLGKEAMSSVKVPVYAMPRMREFLTESGPWSQLVNNQNIKLFDLENEVLVDLSSNIKVIPHLVPHRDEYSETVGFTIIGPNKKALFIPDIDKWSKWEKNIIEEISKVDYAFIDATFFNGNEINTRDISEIPHPFIIESMNLFKDLSEEEKSKIIFIHFNHTNPLLNEGSPEAKQVLENGFRFARIYDIYEL